MITLCSVLYNDSQFIDNFFHSITALSVNKIDEIIIFDNASTDSTLLKLNKLITNTRILNASRKINVIKNKTNIGYTKGINVCIKKSKNEVILLLNPDAILNEDAIDKLLVIFNQNKRAVVGGKLIDFEESISCHNRQNSAVLSVSFLNCLLELTNVGKFPFLHKSNNFWEKGNDLKEVIGVSGGFMMFARSTYHNLNGFDEDYWMYLEDLDFCIRARKKGYKIFFEPAAKLRHFGGGSSAGVSQFHHNEDAWYSSRDVFFYKHFSKRQFYFYLFLSKIEKIILYLRNFILKREPKH